MKIEEPRITLLVNEDYVSIEIEDWKAAGTILNVKLTPQQFVSVLSGLSCVDCEAEIFNTDKINKKMEHKSFKFEVPDWHDKEYAQAHVEELCPEGWEPDTFFNSQSSFFSKDGKNYARCTIRRWV